MASAGKCVFSDANARRGLCFRSWRLCANGLPPILSPPGWLSQLPVAVLGREAPGCGQCGWQRGLLDKSCEGWANPLLPTPAACLQAGATRALEPAGAGPPGWQGEAPCSRSMPARWAWFRGDSRAGCSSRCVLCSASGQGPVWGPLSSSGFPTACSPLVILRSSQGETRILLHAALPGSSATCPPLGTTGMGRSQPSPGWPPAWA